MNDFFHAIYEPSRKNLICAFSNFISLRYFVATKAVEARNKSFPLWKTAIKGVFSTICNRR
jgi:hypothetical protein